MLTRIRIEVEGADSAAACEAELTKYEHALQATEADRYASEFPPAPVSGRFQRWSVPGVERDFYNTELGRAVTDEVIEYDPSLPGYKGRRVVQFNRIDMRGMTYGRADQPEVGAAERLSA